VRTDKIFSAAPGESKGHFCPYSLGDTVGDAGTSSGAFDKWVGGVMASDVMVSS
jgi:hypothetical protein